MMSKTHLVIGVASSVWLMQPRSVREGLTAVLGGAVGGLISDLDQPSSHAGRDVSRNALTIVITLAGVLLADQILGAGFWDAFLASARTPQFLGTAVFLGLCFGLTLSPHRGFSHSILALALLAAALRLAYGPLVPAFCAGFVSHIALDLLNKRPVRLFFPVKKGVCLGLCYADQRTNRMLSHAGLAAIALYVAVTVAAFLAK